MSKTRTSDVPLTGVAIGAVALALVVVFAVLLPKAEGDTADTSRITMPTSLPGGYRSATLTEAWKTNPSAAANAAAIAKEVKAEITYGNAALQKTTGGGFGNAIYLGKGGNSVFFAQAFRSAGGAFSPGEISDPSHLQSGTSVDQLTTVGDAVCIITGQVASAGQIQPAQSKCQVTKGGLTVQATGAGAASDTAKVADLVLDRLH